MFNSKLFWLEVITIGNRSIYPIARLTYDTIGDFYHSINYEVVAIRVDEDDQTYYKNISMSKLEFSKLDQK